MSEAESAAIHVHGHCYCGAVRYEVAIPAGASPIFTAYCHCDSCRRAHAAPLYHVAAVEASMMTITEGVEHIREYTRPDAHLVRCFCDTCGTKIRNLFPTWTPRGKDVVAFFPSTLDEAIQHDLPDPLRPKKHNCPDETVLDATMLATFFDRH